MSSRRHAWRERSGLETHQWTSPEHVALVKRLSEAVDLLLTDWREKHRPQAEEAPADATPDVADGLVVKRVLRSLAAGAHEQLLLMHVLKRVTEPVALAAGAGDEAGAGAEEYLLCPSPALRALLGRVAAHVEGYVNSVQHAVGSLLHRTDTLLAVGHVAAQHGALKAELRTDLCDTLAVELDRELAESARWHEEVAQERLRFRCVEAAVRNGREHVVDVRPGAGGAAAGSAVQDVSRLVAELVAEEDLPTEAAPMVPAEEWRWDAHHHHGSLAPIAPDQALQRIVASEAAGHAHTSVRHAYAAFLEELADVLRATPLEPLGADLRRLREELEHARDTVHRQVHAQAAAESGSSVLSPPALTPLAGQDTPAVFDLSTLPASTGPGVLSSLALQRAAADRFLAQPTLLVSPLASGAAQVGVIQAASHFYRVAVDEDDSVVLLSLQQLAPLAARNNYLEVFVQYDVPPALQAFTAQFSTLHAHALSFRERADQPGDRAARPHLVPPALPRPPQRELDEWQGTARRVGGFVSHSSRADAELHSAVTHHVPCRGRGNIFLRVTAHGVDVKRYKLTARVQPAVPDFSGALGRIADDLETQVQWQAAVGDKLEALGHARDAHERRQQEEAEAAREREELERRRRRAARKYRDHLRQLQSAEEGANAGQQD